MIGGMSQPDRTERIDDPDDPDEYVSSGRFVEITKVENQDSWLAYVVAEK